MILDFCKNWIFQKESGEPISVDLPHDAMIIEPRDGRQIVVATDKTWIVYKFFDLSEGTYLLKLEYCATKEGKLTVENGNGAFSIPLGPSNTYVGCEIPCRFPAGIQSLVLQYVGTGEVKIQSVGLSRGNR